MKIVFTNEIMSDFINTYWKRNCKQGRAQHFLSDKWLLHVILKVKQKELISCMLYYISLQINQKSIYPYLQNEKP